MRNPSCRHVAGQPADRERATERATRQRPAATAPSQARRTLGERVPTPPDHISWSSLTASSRETAVIIGLRMTAGMSTEEIADELERDRAQVKRNVLPAYDRPITKSWVSARMRDLRRDIERTSDP